MNEIEESPEYIRMVKSIPEVDYQVLQSAVDWWTDTKMHMMGVHPFEQITRPFELAKKRLDDRNLLPLVYGENNGPGVLNEIMHSFLAGRTTRDEVLVRLNDCIGALKKWLPLVFPDLARS